jgi:type I restriction enzyme, S subunit
METARGFVMVEPSLQLQSLPQPTERKTPPFKYTTVAIQEIVEKDYRMEASVFGVEGRQARKALTQCKWPILTLCGDKGLATAYHRPRFKRVYADKSDFPIYQPAQINDLAPKPSAYISDLTHTDIDALKVKKGQILLTCSGTIGNCTYVRNTVSFRQACHESLNGIC